MNLCSRCGALITDDDRQWSYVSIIFEDTYNAAEEQLCGSCTNLLADFMDGVR